MQEKELTYKAKLYNTVKSTYKNHPKLDKLMDFKLVYEKKNLKRAGAYYQYDKRKKTGTIRMLLNGVNYKDLLMSVLIHEVSHHIEYMLYGSTGHGKNFRDIQQKLLYTAFDKNYLNPYKLKAYYLYLSSYSEMNKVVKMIDCYIKQNQPLKNVHFIGYNNFPYIKEEVKKMSENGFIFYKGNTRHSKNIWWKFTDDYQEVECKYGEVIRV